MITWPIGTKIFLADQSVDFRKSVTGLSLIIADDYDENPGAGDVYIFFNKRRNSLKVLYFDGNGFMLWYKRLSRGCFKIDRYHTARITLSEQELKWLLSGLDFKILSTLPPSYSVYD